MEFNVFQNNKALMKVQEENGWKLYKFDDILIDDTRNAIKIKKELYLEYGEYPIIDQGKNEIAGYTNEVEGIYKEEALVFGDHTRIIKYIDFPIFLGADGVKLLKLKSNKEKISIKYLYYFLNTVKLPSDGYSRHFKYLKQIVIPVPELDIQMKIVKCLDKANELIDKRKKQIDILDELVKSKFIEMFGDPAFNPKEWNIKSFDEVFNISSSSRILKSEWKTEGTIPFYRVRDMVFLSENGVANNEFFVSEEFYESLQNEKGTPQYGDIMVSATSTIGKCYIVKPGEKFYYKDADILRFRKKVELAPEYFIHFMKTSFAVNQIERTFGITTVPHFTIVNSKKINMIYPPIELQNKFADFVKQVDKLKFQMEKSLEELQYNFNSLMQRAFNGELFI